LLSLDFVHNILLTSISKANTIATSHTKAIGGTNNKIWTKT